MFLFFLLTLTLIYESGCLTVVSEACARWATDWYNNTCPMDKRVRTTRFLWIHVSELHVSYGYTCQNYTCPMDTRVRITRVVLQMSAARVSTRFRTCPVPTSLCVRNLIQLLWRRLHWSTGDSQGKYFITIKKIFAAGERREPRQLWGLRGQVWDGVQASLHQRSEACLPQYLPG